jgi:hypothetical protein
MRSLSAMGMIKSQLTDVQSEARRDEQDWIRISLRSRGYI